MRNLILIPILMLTACAGKTVYVDRVVEVSVPVSVPCVADRPDEPQALRDKLGRPEWDALSTDQRENLVGAQALERKNYGDRLTVATAGCR